MDVFSQLTVVLQEHSQRTAMVIRGEPHSYGKLDDQVHRIRGLIRSSCMDGPIVGLIAHDDLLTYASIIALWSEGLAYTPIMPGTPKDRVKVILEKAGCSTVLSAGPMPDLVQMAVLDTSLCPPAEVTPPRRTNDDQLAYLLFTSGSTGVPKGVPITRKNLNAFMDAFWGLGITMSPSDRCLQMFDLTFDLSVMSFLAPMSVGASLYPVPEGSIKYSTIFELMEDHELTHALMVPSILNYLRPYFDEIDLPSMRYSLFCGEALSAQLCSEWGRCIPNAQILNVYGPTEATIFCTSHPFSRTGGNKQHNGILAIGQPMRNTTVAVVDDDGTPVRKGDTGELCLMGDQVTPGYWRDEEGKNKAAFFSFQSPGGVERAYRTGDLVIQDDDGDLLYKGRKDQQVQIQGFRVELPEVEHHARQFLREGAVAVVAFTNSLGNQELGMVLDRSEQERGELLTHLRAQLPAYMVPTSIRLVRELPLNANGKVDRNALIKSFEQHT